MIKPSQLHKNISDLGRQLQTNSLQRDKECMVTNVKDVAKHLGTTDKNVLQRKHNVTRVKEWTLQWLLQISAVTEDTERELLN